MREYSSSEKELLDRNGNERASVNFFNKLSEIKLFQCIKSGLIMVIPIIIIGSIALVLKSFPIAAYQDFIKYAAGGFLYDLFSIIYNATTGLFSIFLCCAISASYNRIYAKSNVTSANYGATVTSLICFLIFSGVGSYKFSLENFGIKGTFTAILCALLASFLYHLTQAKSRSNLTLYTDGADGHFKSAINILIPCGVTVLFFALVSILLKALLGISCFQELLLYIFNNAFSGATRSLPSALIFVFVSHFLWFFGIHGGNVLQDISNQVFVPGQEINEALVRYNFEPTEIFSKSFLDSFVLMGGCGATLCLLFALLFFSKRKSNRYLAGFSLAPAIFNINEPLVFGLPICFNPTLIIPFLITPLAFTFTSTFATYMGWVPIVTNSVEWTTPIILSGYIATGSIAGSILQIVNLLIGFLIYLPFVRIFDRQKVKNAHTQMHTLVATLKRAESNNESINLIDQGSYLGVVARSLSEELKIMIRKHQFQIYYQPQFDAHGKCVGAEALLRWEHPLYGFIYPPLIIELAKEVDILEDLECLIISKVADDMHYILETMGEDFRISVNLTPLATQSDKFNALLNGLVIQGSIIPKNICIEVTEQIAISFNQATLEHFSWWKEAGFMLSIDDFSMGSTSIKYLQRNLFDQVKLDGGIVKDMLNNSRSEKIIASITSLSAELGFEVIAEYVESEEQKEMLVKLGCDFYQGWLYSPAVPLLELKNSTNLI